MRVCISRPDQNFLRSQFSNYNQEFGPKYDSAPDLGTLHQNFTTSQEAQSYLLTAKMASGGGFLRSGKTLTYGPQT